MRSLLIGASENPAALVALVAMFVLFVGLVLWIYRPGGRRTYDKYGSMPLEENSELGDKK